MVRYPKQTVPFIIKQKHHVSFRWCSWYHVIYHFRKLASGCHDLRQHSTPSLCCGPHGVQRTRLDGFSATSYTLAIRMVAKIWNDNRIWLLTTKVEQVLSLLCSSKLLSLRRVYNLQPAVFSFRGYSQLKLMSNLQHKDPALPACTSAAYVGVHLHWNFVQLLYITAILSLGSKLRWWPVSEFGLCPLTARHDKGLHLLKQLSTHLFVIFVCDVLLIFTTIFERHTISIVDCLLHHPKHCGIPLQQNNSQTAPRVTWLASTQLSLQFQSYDPVRTKTPSHEICKIEHSYQPAKIELSKTLLRP